MVKAKITRVGALVALAAAAVLALSGCVPTDSAMKNNLIELELAHLAATLNGLPYVGPVEAVYDETAAGAPLRVKVGANAATNEQALVIAVTVNASLSSELLSTVDRLFELHTGGGLQLWQFEFGLTPEELATELRYVFDVQDAVGDRPVFVSIDRAQGDIDGGDYSRIIDAGQSYMYPEEWEALRAVRDPSSSPERGWYFPGVSIVGSLPPQEVTDVLYRLTQTLPQANAQLPTGTGWSTWTSTDQRLDVLVESYDDGNESEEFSTQTMWPEVVRAAGALSAPGLSNASLSFATNANAEHRTGIVHFGSCVTVERLLARDRELAEALVASGVELPDGSGPGYCAAF